MLWLGRCVFWEALLHDIRESRFDPDETRSGRFMKPATSIVVKDESKNEDVVGGNF